MKHGPTTDPYRPYARSNVDILYAAKWEFGLSSIGNLQLDREARTVHDPLQDRTIVLPEDWNLT